MADRVPSDHPSIETIRATLVRRGSTNRPAIELPEAAADSFPTGEAVRVVLDGDERHAVVEAQFGRVLVPGIYDSPAFARDPGSAPNRLVEWTERVGRPIGGTVLVDVIEPGFKYGVREPGDRAIYRATSRPDDSLASIAERVERGGTSPDRGDSPR